MVRSIKNTLNKYKVTSSFSIRDAVKWMDDGGNAFCVCVDAKDQVLGVISDGDFRRAIHDGIQLDENVTKIINRNFYSVQKGYDNKELEEIFANPVIDRIPVLEKGKLVDVISAEELHKGYKGRKRRILENPVIIMAGGKGTRLDPFTRILPKPLIPLGNDPIIKVIMDDFHKFGINKFYISLKEKEKMVRAYFHDHDLGYHIDYINEDKPLGTAGALKYLEGKIKEPFFVSNCDIIIRTDYGSFFDFHKKGGYGLTLVGSMRQYIIPYGVCEIDSGGVLKAIREKPQYDFLVNTGLYILEPEVLRYIPKNTFFDMTDLIGKIKERGLKIGVFPVSEKSWIDIGQLSEYQEMVNKLNLPIY